MAYQSLYAILITMELYERIGEIARSRGNDVNEVYRDVKKKAGLVLEKGKFPD